VKHDGSQVVVFTKPEYRQLHGPIPAAPLAAGSTPVDEGEEADDRPSAAADKGDWARRQKSKRQKTSSGNAGGSGGKAARRPVRGRKQQLAGGQQTLDEFVKAAR
jgi:hypothetical protein